MKIILLQSMKKLGTLGDTVSVKPGFARNYLFPQGKALRASAENLKIFAEQKHELELKAQKELLIAQERGQKLVNVVVTVKANASEDSKLYGSVGPGEISSAFKELHHIVEKNEIQMPQGVIRILGEHTINVSLHHGAVVIPITVKVISNT